MSSQDFMPKSKFMLGFPKNVLERLGRSKIKNRHTIWNKTEKHQEKADKLLYQGWDEPRDSRG